jgi:hypothetical protein
MASPSSPLALTAAYLTVLQSRQPLPAPAAEGQPNQAAKPTQPTPVSSGRGRLIDIIV